MESAVGIHFRRGKRRVSSFLADGTRLFILLSKQVEILISTYSLQNNTNQSAAALVHNLLQRLLQLHLCILRHPINFILHPVTDHRAQRPPENIQIPDFLRLRFVIRQSVGR